MRASKAPDEQVLVALTRDEAMAVRAVLDVVGTLSGAINTFRLPVVRELHGLLDDALEETLPRIVVAPTSFELPKRTLSVVGFEELGCKLT